LDVRENGIRMNPARPLAAIKQCFKEIVEIIGDGGDDLLEFLSLSLETHSQNG
jgi:hypothetical protein